MYVGRWALERVERGRKLKEAVKERTTGMPHDLSLKVTPHCALLVRGYALFDLVRGSDRRSYGKLRDGGKGGECRNFLGSSRET
jgi:hypothetical protein